MIGLLLISTLMLQIEGYRLPGMTPTRLKIFRYSELIDSIKNQFLSPQIESLLYWKPTVEMEEPNYGNDDFFLMQFSNH